MNEKLELAGDHDCNTDGQLELKWSCRKTRCHPMGLPTGCTVSAKWGIPEFGNLYDQLARERRDL